jgi:hypothetical protein
MPAGYLDVHQHLWPPEFVAALRARRHPPMLRGWLLHTAGEPPYAVHPADHDPALRCGRDRDAARVLVSLSTPLGVEDLPPDEAAPLLASWHAGAGRLGEPFAPWAAVSHREPDLDGLKALFVDQGFAGLQLSATRLATPRHVERAAGVLRRCEELGRPVLVHPGPVGATADVPPWWAAVVDYPAQLQAAWWSWREEGRRLLPDLRICFVAGAGLAPAHHERFAARAGRSVPVDRNVFVETSSYGRQGVDALIRALGIDVVVLGSDRPYAEPFTSPDLGAAARHAIEVANPTRLLEGEHR